MPVSSEGGGGELAAEFSSFVLVIFLWYDLVLFYFLEIFFVFLL